MRLPFPAWGSKEVNGFLSYPSMRLNSARGSKATSPAPGSCYLMPSARLKASSARLMPSFMLQRQARSPAPSSVLSLILSARLSLGIPSACSSCSYTLELSFSFNFVGFSTGPSWASSQMSPSPRISWPTLLDIADPTILDWHYYLYRYVIQE